MSPPPDPAELPRALKAGEVQPVQVVGTYLRRIELLDDSGPTLNAVLQKNPDAVAEARRLATEREQTGETGLLYGLPILIKDNIETKDMPTTAGSLALRDNDTGRDAFAAARLRGEGAIILGKTNLSEWANFRSNQSVSGWSAMGGLTRNPHDLSRNACGSSSGSGAAVAAGLAWGALGTETNGSVTCPAAMNGIVGFKPTVGLVSRQGVVPISPTQDTIGPMTPDVRGAALLMQAMAGSDAGDPATEEADGRKPDFLAALDDASLQGLRLGVLRWAESDHPAERAVFDEALRRAEEAGAVLVDIEEGGIEASGADAFLVLKAEFRDALPRYLETAAPDVTVRSLEDVIAFNEKAGRELVLFGQNILEESSEAPLLEDPEYLEARERVMTATRGEGIDRLLRENDVDLLVAPSFGAAFKIDLVRGDVIGSNAGAGWLAAIAGYPHLTQPMGGVAGLPLGLSLIGPKWSDAKVLAAGYALENVLPARLEPGFRKDTATEKLYVEAARPAR